MTWIWTVPPDSVRTRPMKSATGRASDGPAGVLAIRKTTGPPADPPALSPLAEALHPEAVTAATASASRAPAILSFMSGSRQGDVQLEDGPVRGEREHLTVRPKDRRLEQGVRRARPFRDQPVSPVVDQRGPGLRDAAAARHVRVPGGVDRRLAYVPGR